MAERKSVSGLPVVLNAAELAGLQQPGREPGFSADPR